MYRYLWTCANASYEWKIKTSSGASPTKTHSSTRYWSSRVNPSNASYSPPSVLERGVPQRQRLKKPLPKQTRSSWCRTDIYIYIYVLYIDVCIYTCIYVYMYVCMYVYIFTHRGNPSMQVIERSVLFTSVSIRERSSSAAAADDSVAEAEAVELV